MPRVANARFSKANGGETRTRRHGKPHGEGGGRQQSLCGVEARQSQQGVERNRRADRRGVREKGIVAHPRNAEATARGTIQTRCGQRGANPEAERGDAAVGNTHGERPNRPAGGGASLKPAIRKGVLGIEFRLSSEAERASSLEARKCVCGRGLLDSGGPRPRKVLRQGESHETHGKACKGYWGRSFAAADTQVPQGRSHAKRRMPQTRGRNSARRAFVAAAGKHRP